MASTELAARKPGGIVELLNDKRIIEQIREAVPEHITVERLIRLAKNAMQRGGGLLKCTPLSLLAGVVEFAQLGLELDNVMGEGYLVPFNTKKGDTIATPIVGYKGFMKLSYQTAQIYKIVPHVVRKDDRFQIAYGTSPVLIHDPKTHGDEEDDSNWVGVYAVAHFNIGTTDFEFLEREDVLARRARSAAWRSKKEDTPWRTDTEAMWRKTAIRALCNRLPKSSTDLRLARAVAVDELSEIGKLEPTVTGYQALPVGDEDETPTADEPAKHAPKAATPPPIQRRSQQQGSLLDQPEAKVEKRDSTPPPKLAGKGTASPVSISVSQQEKFMAMCNNVGWSMSEVERALKEQFRFDSVSEIPKSMYDEIFYAFENPQK